MYERFAKLMNEKNMTHYRVWRETGVSQSSLNDWKNGRGVPGARNLARLADYFGVSVDYLIGKNDEKKLLVNNDEELTEYLEILKNREECRMLFSVAKGATKEDVERAVKIIEALRKG